MTDDFPFAEINVFQLGLYAQDKWTVSDKLNLTLGLRIDVPFFMTDFCSRMIKSPPRPIGMASRSMFLNIRTAKPQFSPPIRF